MVGSVGMQLPDRVTIRQIGVKSSKTSSPLSTGFVLVGRLLDRLVLVFISEKPLSYSNHRHEVGFAVHLSWRSLFGSMNGKVPFSRPNRNSRAILRIFRRLVAILMRSRGSDLVAMVTIFCRAHQLVC